MTNEEYIDDNPDTSSVIKNRVKNCLRDGITKEDYTEYINSRNKTKESNIVAQNR